MNIKWNKTNPYYTNIHYQIKTNHNYIITVTRKTVRQQTDSQNL